MESLVTYVNELQSLNEKVKPEFPKITGKDLIRDPDINVINVVQS